MPTVQTGDRAQDSWATDREDLDFADRIALLNPNENPLTLIAMRMGKGTSGNIKHQWVDDETQPVFVQMQGAATTTATTFDLTSGEGARLQVGDLLRAINDKNEVMLYLATAATDEIQVDRDYGQGGTPGYTARADTLADNDFLEVIGNAFEQGHPLPVIKNTLEVVRMNFCQDLRTPVGITEVAAAARVHGEQDWPYQLRKKGIEHMNYWERTNMFGVAEDGDQGAFDGTNNTGPQAAGGLYFYINEYADASRQVIQADITQQEFLDFLEAGFEFGSRQKVLFAPSLLRSAIDFWGIAKLNTTPDSKAFGIDVSRWISSHGLVTIVTHKLLKDPLGTSGVWAFLIDVDELKWITYSNIGATKLRMVDPYKSDGSTLKQAEYQTLGCLEVRQANKHAMLERMTSYSA